MAPRRCRRASENFVGVLGEQAVVSSVPGANGVGLVRLVEAIPSVLPQGLQLGISGLVGGRHSDERLVHERADRVEGVGAWHLIVGADRLDSVEFAAADEDRQAAKQAPLVIEEEVVAPVHDRSQGLLARQRRAGAAGEQREAVVESLGER